MKEIIVLRHGDKDGDKLTEEGIRACETLASRIGKFNVVIASNRNRTIQTAELVSGNSAHADPRASVPLFPDNELEKLADIQATHPLGIIGAIWQKEPLINDAREAGQKLLDLVQDVMASLPENGRALIVSHDGTMIGLEKLLKNESFDHVDHSFGPIEGLRIDEHFRVSAFK